MSPVARIVQWSDLHLSGDRRRSDRSWTNLQRVVDRLPELEPFDRLILTGDLARRSIARAYEGLREWLQPWHDRLRVLPGNHDGRQLLASVFADRFEPGTSRFEDLIAGWRLIGLDSKRAWRVHGRIGDSQLRWLATRLQQPQTRTLLFFHHPPMPTGTWWLDKDVLRDADELSTLLRDDGLASVRGLFCGHIHQEFDGEFAGVPLHGCPSTCYQFTPASRRPASVQNRNPAFRLIDLDVDSFTTRVERMP